MMIELVEPGHVEHEVDQPVYRVYFWHRPATSSRSLRDMAYHCEEHSSATLRTFMR